MFQTKFGRDNQGGVKEGTNVEKNHGNFTTVLQYDGALADSGYGMDVY